MTAAAQVRVSRAETYSVEIVRNRLPYCPDDLGRGIPSESPGTFDPLHGLHKDLLCTVAETHLRRGQHKSESWTNQTY